MGLYYLLVYCFTLAYGSKLYFGSSQIHNYDTDNFHLGRVRRSLSPGSNTSCMDVLDKEAEKEISTNLFPLKDDRNMDLQLVFLGKNSEIQVLLTTMTENSFMNFFMPHHQSSNLYQTTDGGMTFQKIENKIGSSSIRSTHGIMKSPLDPNWIIFVSYTSAASTIFGIFSHINQKSVLLISKDAGKNFTSFEMPFKLRENEPLLFHPKKKNWIIGLEERKTIKINMGKAQQYGQSWISKDFGKTWKEMMKGHVAASVKWGAAEGKEGDEIYLATHVKSSSNSISSFFSLFISSSSTLTLWKSSDGGTFFEEIIEHCYNFGVEGDFVFASVIFNVSNDKHDHKRIMHVSKDSGSNFRPVNVPEITSDRFYAVLEMHKGMIFLHVDDDLDTGKGTLFISGSDGIMYTKSLDNHFYTNNGFTDFNRIESMHGVYITQVLQKDNTLKSVITFDRGVSWQPLYVDKKYCKNNDELCMIHFHKDYSTMKRHIDVQGPLSSASAPGIIFMHGQSGDALTGTAQVWLSINGGYNWTKIADTPHHYAIGDNGNLLVVVPRMNNTGNILRYSIDQGRCWHDVKFTLGNQEMVIRGLITEPHAKDRTFSLWGFFKDVSANKKEWNVITINFHGMFSNKCDDNDFEKWTPHILNRKSGCFLGEIMYYKKPKLSASCYLGKDFKPLLGTEKCRCDKDDIECDYGYERQNNGACKQNKSIKPIEICKKGEKVVERFSKGYRRVPGDECEAIKAIDDVVKWVDENIKCKPSKENVYGIIKEEKKLVVENKQKEEESNKDDDDEGGAIYESKSRPLRSKGHGFFVLIAILLAIAAIIAGGWYVVKFIRKKRSFTPTYIISELTEELGENRDVVYDPRPKSQRQFQDESDMDDDLLLPV